MKMRNRLAVLILIIAANVIAHAQVGRLGQATVVDPSGTIAAGAAFPTVRRYQRPGFPMGLSIWAGIMARRVFGGCWSVPNFAGFTPDTPKNFNRGQRGGAPNEPFVPFQPWSAAVYNYNSLNEGKSDPEGFCFPPGGPRAMATPFPAEIIQPPEQKRILIILRRRY